MFRRLTIAVIVCGFWISTESADASFHLWEIKEVYSNSDGTVQFIELFSPANSQQLTFNTSIKTSFFDNTFVFPSNTPDPTLNRRLLLATPGFELLPGGVKADFNITADFFNPATDFIDYVGTFPAGKVSLFNTPTDGLNSSFFPGNNPGINSPTNFAGDVGKLVTLGDMNEDGTVDSDDVGPFIQALVDRPAFEAAHMGVNADLVGNVNGDSQFDFGDIAEFEVLAGASGLAAALGVPEPSSLIQIAIGILSLLGLRRRQV